MRDGRVESSRPSFSSGMYPHRLVALRLIRRASIAEEARLDLPAKPAQLGKDQRFADARYCQLSADSSDVGAWDNHPPQAGAVFSFTACQPVQGDPFGAMNGEHATLRRDSLAGVNRRNCERQLPLQLLPGDGAERTRSPAGRPLGRAHIHQRSDGSATTDSGPIPRHRRRATIVPNGKVEGDQ